ncbi:bifunctional diguanylate cyclase/phosphodiesterase [Vibrio splendidus]|uniref:bifunctional diguanylate cyclase/phosphodiesterase n=1 Tax=Vibrio splendidus TaxID=29497 RepID=UPI0015E686F9|nr:EAL domain-containing protein [Vibrio splendidus]
MHLHLTTAKMAIENHFSERGEYLSAFALTVVKDFGLKQSINEDVKSFLVALDNHRHRIKADLTMLVNKDGTISGTLFLDENNDVLGDLIKTKFKNTEYLTHKDENLFYVYQSKLYQLIVVPLKSGPEIIAWLGFGFTLDSELASKLSNLTGMSVGFVHKNDKKWKVFGSSEKHLEPLVAEYQNKVKGPKTKYAITNAYIGDASKGNVNVLIYDKKENILASVTERWMHILTIFVLTFITSVLLAYALARSIARPLKELTEKTIRVAKGEYSVTLSIDRKDEIGLLATEFNLMGKAILKKQAELSFKSNHNDLTSLPNRKSLVEDLVNLIDTENSFKLLRFRLLDYDELNYSLGIETGEALQILISNIQDYKDLKLQIYQLDASEFILVLDRYPDSTEFPDFYQKNALHKLEGSYESTTIDISIRTVSGTSSYPQDGNTPRELLHNAGIALQQALKNHIPILEYNYNMSEQAINRVQITHDLSRAIKENQLALHYQPKINLDTNNADSVEALIRWFHPIRGLISPDEFISIAETTGQIDALTDWAIDTAMKQVSIWRSLGTWISVAVNISAINLTQRDFDKKISHYIELYELDNKALILEITETALADDPLNSFESLYKLSKRQFTISVDDYGTGYSSLLQIKNVPATELKIDKTFVLDLAVNKKNRIIVQSTIELAHRLGMQVVAEGVEDKETFDWLKAQGCEYVQGFYICRPIPAEQILNWLHVRSRG